MITQFSQFVGNLRTVEGVTAALQSGRLPQTIIIEGPVGSGRKTLARLIAAGVFCERDLPCGCCDSCRKVFVTGHADFTVITPEKNKAQIGVDQIRAVRADAFIRPVEAKGKVFVIDGVMNDAAQNAFLKVLEEPPSGVHFILVCEHRNLLMDTVLSRGVVFSLGEVSYKEALPLLEQRGCLVTPEEFLQQGNLIGGVVEKEDLLAVSFQIAKEMAMALGKECRSDLLRAVAKAVDHRPYHGPVLDALSALLHDAMLLCVNASSVGTPEECVVLLSRRFTKERLLQLSQILANARKKTVYNLNGNLFFTALCGQLLPRS